MDFEKYCPTTQSGGAIGAVDPAQRVDILAVSLNNISSTTVAQPISDADTTPVAPVKPGTMFTGARHHPALEDEDRFSIDSSDPEDPVKPSALRFIKPAASEGSDTEDPRDQCNLYISGLPSAFTEHRLGELFGAFGPIVSCKLMLNIHTGESRGFAFVLFQRPESAHKAVAEMDHVLVDGSRLTVRFAEKRARQCGLPTKKIFIRNIPVGVTEGDIRLLLGADLPIVQLSMRPDPYRPSARPAGAALAPNVAHVIFETFDAATAAAKKLHNSMPWSACTVPVLAKVVDTGVRAKREQKRSEPRPTAPPVLTGSTPQSAERAILQHQLTNIPTPFSAPYTSYATPTYVMPFPQMIPQMRPAAAPYYPAQASQPFRFVQSVPTVGFGAPWPSPAPLQVPVFMPNAPSGVVQAPPMFVAPPAAASYPTMQHPYLLHPYFAPAYGDYR